MEPDTYLAVFIECDETGVEPLVWGERLIGHIKQYKERVIVKEGGGF